MEKGTVTTTKFFKSANKLENTKKMIHFIARVLEAFKILNFDGHYYHGDVKPANLLFIRTEPNGDYEPRLIDFDLMFKREKKEDHPGFLVYTRDYRAPELREIVPGFDFDKDKVKEAEQEAAYSTYEFNEDFKEEAFAVGKTILDIIENNKAQLNLENEQFKAINQIAKKMVEVPPANRLSTKEVYDQVPLSLKANIILI